MKLYFSIYFLLFALKLSVEAYFSILAKMLLLCWCQKLLQTFYNPYWLLVRFFYTYLCSKGPKKTFLAKNFFVGLCLNSAVAPYFSMYGSGMPSEVKMMTFVCSCLIVHSPYLSKQLKEESHGRVVFWNPIEAHTVKASS